MAGPIEFRDSSLNFEQAYSEEIDKAEEFELKARGILKKIKVGEGGFFGFFVYLKSDKPFVENQIDFWERAVAPIKLDLADALKTIQALRKKLENREISEREKTTLLEQEREFIIIQRKLTALKTVIVERMRRLPSLKPIISKTFQSREEFDRRHEDLISEIAKVQKLLNHRIHETTTPKPAPVQIQEKTQEARQKLSQAFDVTMTFYNAVKQLAGGPAAREIAGEMKKSYDALMKQHKTLGSAKTPDDFEELKYPYLDAIQNFELRLSEVLFPHRGNLEINTKIRELGQHLTKRKKELHILIGQPEEPSDSFEGVEEVIYMPQTAVVQQTWKYKPWAQLIAPTDYKDAAKAAIGMSFTQKLTRAKDTRAQIVEEERTARAGSLEQKHLVEQRNALDNARFQVVLQRIVDVLGEKQRLFWQVHDGKLKMDIKDLDILMADIDILQRKWDKTMTRFKQLPRPERSLVEAFKGSGYETVVSILTLGFYSVRDVQPKEFEQNKLYADLGYSMRHCIKDWMSSFTVQPGKTPFEQASTELWEFMDWAESNPITAATMFGDMALTLKLLVGDDQGLIDRFQEVFAKQAFAVALAAPHGVREMALPPKRDWLKYKALADVSKILPSLVGLEQGIKQGIIKAFSEGNVGWSTLFTVYKGGVSAKLVQDAAALLPVSYSHAATSAAAFIKGESFHHIIETQSKIRLVTVASLAREAILNPTNFVKHTARALKIWWKTMTMARGKELFYRVMGQVVAPLGCLVGGITLLVISVAGAPFTIAIGTALWIAFLLFGSSITIPWRLNSPLSKVFATGNEAKKWIAEEEIKEFDRNKRESLAKLIKRRMKKKSAKELERAGKDYIFELQVHEQLPYTRSLGDKKLLTKRDERIIKRLIKEYEGTLDEEERTGDAIDHFNTHCKLNDMQVKAKKCLSEEEVKSKEALNPITKHLKAREIIHRVTTGLLERWLRPKLVDQMVDKVAWEHTTPPEKVEKPLSLDTYLEDKIPKAKEREAVINLFDDKRSMMRGNATMTA